MSANSESHSRETDPKRTGPVPVACCTLCYVSADSPYALCLDLLYSLYTSGIWKPSRISGATVSNFLVRTVSPLLRRYHRPGEWSHDLGSR